MDRAILHCDMNNFFASVECLLNPDIKYKPVAVCGSEKERHGIVLARNYLAKEYGVTVGNPIWMAKQKCPGIIIISTPHFSEYHRLSKLAHEIYLRYTDLVEPFGIDECWLDITASLRLFGSPKKIADEIRETIKKELGLTISVGVSFNKIFAKLGSDMKKPDATTEITKENFRDIVWPLPASDLLGVGRQTKKFFDKYYIKTIGDIAREKPDTLVHWLGKGGEMLYNYANGLDDSEVSLYTEPDEVKSVSHGTTTKRDLVNNDDVWKVMLSLTQEIAYKLRDKKLRATGIYVNIRDNTLINQQFQKKLPISEQSAINIAKEAFSLFKSKYAWEKPIRTVTVAAINLIPESTPEQMNLFIDKDNQVKIEKAESCMENINKKYGENRVKNATLSALMGDDHP